MSKDKKASYIGTPRSQRSMLAERDLKISLQKVRASVVRTEEKVADLEGTVERLTEKVTTQGRVEFQNGFDRAITDLARIRGRIGPYKAEAARLEAAIQALQPSQGETDARHDCQHKFVNFADARLECDRRAAPLIAELRQILSERARLSGEMQRAAKSFDLEVLSDTLDTRRVESLLEVLPENILPESEAWSGSFFGNSKTEKTYVVVVDWLVLPETFADAGIHTFGDHVKLTEKVAHELLRRDRKETSSSDLLPPDLMTEEDFETQVAAAKVKGISVEAQVAEANLRFIYQAGQQTAREKHEAIWGVDNKTHPFGSMQPFNPAAE